MVKLLFPRAPVDFDLMTTEPSDPGREPALFAFGLDAAVALLCSTSHTSFGCGWKKARQ